MSRYALRAVPWGLAGIATAVLAGLMALVGAWPYVMWPLQGTAVGLIAAVVAWAMDERSAAVVDTLPRPLWWRTAARATVAVPVLAAWLGCLLAVRDRIPDRFGLFALQGVAAALLALAVTAWRRAGGAAAPGRPFAAAVVVTAAALALARPVDDRLPLFPVWPDDGWATSGLIWSAVAVGSAAVLAAALTRRPVSAG